MTPQPDRGPTCAGAYAAWREAATARGPAPGTGLARDRWLLPLLRELGYGNVPALSHGYDVEDTHYPISHAREHIPVHLLGPDAQLDRRNPGMLGAARAPQAMVQEFLNRSDGHLWSVLCNGAKLRLLRDSTSLAGSAYVEFDLEAIFDGELYAEFLLLFQLAHCSRLEKRAGVAGSPADCWMEDWRAESVAAGTRALDKLRDGVQAALASLGTGFLRHPDNRWLVDAIRNGQLSDRDYHRALLRLVYRLLFTFVAEDRDALLNPAAAPEARTRYADYFSTARLRRLSSIRRGGPHPDLWQAQRLVLDALGGDGLPQLGAPALGGLYDPDHHAAMAPGQPGMRRWFASLLGPACVLLDTVGHRSSRQVLQDMRHTDRLKVNAMPPRRRTRLPRHRLRASARPRRRPPRPCGRPSRVACVAAGQPPDRARRLAGHMEIPGGPGRPGLRGRDRGGALLRVGRRHGRAI